MPWTGGSRRIAPLPPRAFAETSTPGSDRHRGRRRLLRSTSSWSWPTTSETRITVSRRTRRVTLFRKESHFLSPPHGRPQAPWGVVASDEPGRERARRERNLLPALQIRLEVGRVHPPSMRAACRALGTLDPVRDTGYPAFESWFKEPIDSGLVPDLRLYACSPNGVRTRVATLRGCPKPIP